MSKHEKTLAALFAEPVRANIAWKDVESLFAFLGAEISEGSGSRVRVALHGRRATFHEPHPRKEIGPIGAGLPPSRGGTAVMQYKGYTGRMEVDDEAGIIFGRVIGLRDVITFQGKTVQEARQAFQDSVDDYLEFCAERGEDPERPFSGELVVRVNPDIHQALTSLAETRKTSLDAVVEQVLTDAVAVAGCLLANPRAEGSPVGAKQKRAPRKRSLEHRSKGHTMDAADAITRLYRLTGEDFDHRFAVMSANIKRQLLEEFVAAPAFVADDVDDLLGNLSGALIRVQKTACRDADIAEDQKQDFENRIDHCLADAVITIRNCFEVFGDRTFVDFQLKAAKQLGLPIA
jgi:predicted HicB family RNase H-like nuclease